MIKNQAEISNIEKACKLTDKAFDYILNKIRQGISEKELAFKIEFFIKKNGANIAFPSIVAFGKNSAFPHHKPNNTSLFSTRHSGDQSGMSLTETPESPTLKVIRDSGEALRQAQGSEPSRTARMSSGQFVLIDFGVKFNNYCSDMTRTIFFGKPTSEQKKMYQTVLESQKIAVEYIKNNYSSSEVRSTKSRSSRLANARSNNKVKASNIDSVARDYITSQGYPTIPHSLGHGIGLKVHEPPKLSPKSKDILKPGMVFTIEPGIYIKGFGGVRIEDVMLLEKSHLRVLTKSPRDIIVL